eukprot:749137-Hanusia_phi.AAC.1
MVSLFAVQLSSIGWSGQISLGFTPCESTAWISESVIFCRSPHSSFSFGSCSVVVSLASLPFTLSSSFTYDNLRLVQSHSNFGPVGPGRPLVYEATGLYSISLAVNIGVSSAEESVWISGTSLWCKSSWHSSRSLALVLTSSSLVSSMSSAVSFDVALITVSKPCNSPKTGSMLFSVFGNGFGSSSHSQGARLTSSAAESSLWYSATCMLCLSSSSLTRSSTIQFTTSSVIGSRTQIHSFDRPLVSASVRSNMPQTGSISLSIAGSHFWVFDSTVSFSLIHSSAEATTWISESSIKAKSNADCISTVKIMLSVDLQTSTSSQALSFEAASITVPSNSNSPKTGSTLFTVVGSYFGGQISQTARVHLTGILSTVWNSDTSITVRCAQGGASSSSFVITASHMAGSGTAIFSTDLARTSDVSGRNYQPASSAQIRLYGANYGILAYSGNAVCGDSSTGSTNWISETSVFSKVQIGYQTSRKVQITLNVNIGSQVSNFLSYDSPVLFTYLRPPLDKSVRIDGPLTVIGKSYASFDSTLSIRLGYTNCESSAWVSDTSLLCHVASSISSHNEIIVTAGEKVGTISKCYFYDNPTLSSVRTPNVVFSETTSITVFGKNYGEAAFTDMIRIGGTACENSRWLSESAVVCKPGSAHFLPKTGLPIIVSLGESSHRQIQTVFTLTQAFSYDRYEIHSAGSLKCSNTTD